MSLRHAVLPTLLWSCTACMTVHGGQSGDDGDFIDHGGDPTRDPDALPQPEDGCSEERELDANTPSALGKTATELIAELDRTDLPLHWVNVEASELAIEYSPGPSESKLSLAFALRAPDHDAPSSPHILERLPLPNEQNPTCRGARVHAPVWVNVQSTDGALDERVAGRAVLYGNSTAELSAILYSEDVLGDLAFETSAPSQGWEVSKFRLRAKLWPGGSSGSLEPVFVPTATQKSGMDEVTAAPPPAAPASALLTQAPEIPDHWRAIAVWPRLEQCSLGLAITPHDAVIGKSARDVVEALRSYVNTELIVGANHTATDSSKLTHTLALAPLPTLLCANIDYSARELEFSIPSQLDVTGNGSRPVHLDTAFSLSFIARSNGHTLTSVRFLRSLPETEYPVARSEVLNALGVELNTDEKYAQFWWSFFGHLTDGNSTAPTSQISLVLTASTADEYARAKADLAVGMPGFGVSAGEHGVVLPGDVIWSASTSP